MKIRRHSRLLLLTLAYLAFISLGLPDTVLGLLWPSLRGEFALPDAALGTPLAAGALTYFLSGLLAGKLSQNLGVGGLLAASTVLVAFGVAGYALSPSFSAFLACACIVGFGSGAVDAGLNNYAAREFSARHMSWLHAAYSAGAALGPAIVTALLVRGAGFRTAYAVIAALLATLAVAFVTTRRWWAPDTHAPPSAEPPAGANGTRHSFAISDAFRSDRVRLQVVLFFVYTGVEVGAGQWSYTILTQARGVAPELAGVYVTSYWTALLTGRILSGFFVERVGTMQLVRLGAALAAAGGLLFAMPGLPVVVSALGLVLIGLALAPIFPGSMSETPRRVGAVAAPHVIGFQVSAATAGVAVLPNIGGLLSVSHGLNAVAVFIAALALLLFVLNECLSRRVRATAP